MSDPHGKDVPAADPLAARKAAAEVRVRAALDAIEAAQGLVERAAEALSSVDGLCPAHQKLGRLYDQVQRTWYAVRTRAAAVSRRGELVLDHDPGAQESRWERLS